MTAATLERPATVTQLRAAIYCRVSTRGQAEQGFSLEGQARDCRRYAEQHDYCVSSVYRDVGSGIDTDLPALTAMLDAAARGEFDVLICYDLDRLSRDLAKQLWLEDELRRVGVSIRYVTVPVDDSDEGELTKDVRSVIAKYERTKIRKRLTKGKRDKAALGLVGGVGRAPYGFRYVRGRATQSDRRDRVIGLEADPATAPVVRRIFAELVSYPLLTVADRLAADGVPTPRGAGQWTTGTLLSIVGNPDYTGTYAYGRRVYGRRQGKRRPWKWRDDESLLPVTVPAIVSTSEAKAARQALAERRRRRAAASLDPSADPWELRGALTCGLCGGAIACIPNSTKGVRYYGCLRRQPGRAARQGRERCALSAIPSARLEPYVWELLRATLLDPEYLRLGLAALADADTAARQHRQKLAALKAEVEKLRKRLDAITIERLDAEPGSEARRTLDAAWATSEADIRARLRELAELEASPVVGLSPDDIRQVEATAARIRAGAERATPAERRKIYELLRLRGAVGEDPTAGIALGRRHRFTFEWTSLIEIRSGDKSLQKLDVRNRVEAALLARGQGGAG